MADLLVPGLHLQILHLAPNHTVGAAIAAEEHRVAEEIGIVVEDVYSSTIDPTLDSGVDLKKVAGAALVTAMSATAIDSEIQTCVPGTIHETSVNSSHETYHATHAILPTVLPVQSSTDRAP